MNLQSSSLNPGDEEKGAKVQITWNVSDGNNILWQHNPNDANVNSILSSTSDRSYHFIYVTNITRQRNDTYTVGEQLPLTIDMITSKVQTSTSNRTIEDQYGLWYNASYTYSLEGFNVITGDEVSKTSTIITRPATPENFRQIYDSTLTPRIIMEWDVPLATGNASTVKYYITRGTYTVTGVDVSDNVTQQTVTHNSSISYSNITDTSYNITGLLYGKTFPISMYSYNLNSTSHRSYSTVSQNATVTDYSNTNTDVSFNLIAEQNPVAGTKTLEEDSFGNVLNFESDWINIVIEPYKFGENDPTHYQIFEQYKLLEEIAFADIENNTIKISKRWNGNSKSNITDNQGIYINVVAVHTTNGLYSSSGTTKYIESLGRAPGSITTSSNEFIN